MDWTASEFALVISTSATAITALSGVAIPLWRDASATRSRRREERYTKAAEAVFFCVEHIEEVTAHKRNQAMRMAFYESGLPEPDPEDKKEGDQAERDFQKNLRMAQMLATEAGVDFTKFNSHALTAFTAIPVFHFVDGKLTDTTGDEDLLGTRRKAIEDFVNEGANVLQSFRRSLQVD